MYCVDCNYLDSLYVCLIVLCEFEMISILCFIIIWYYMIIVLALYTFWTLRPATDAPTLLPRLAFVVPGRLVELPFSLYEQSRTTKLRLSSGHCPVTSLRAGRPHPQAEGAGCCSHPKNLNKWKVSPKTWSCFQENITYNNTIHE